MAGFTVKHREHDGTLIDTVKPENLHFTFNKKGVHTISYEYSHAQGVTHDFVGAYRTDFELLFDTTTLMRGMHTDAPDVAREAGFSSVYGKDWKHYLERRHFPFNPNPTNVNDFQVAGTPAGYAFEMAAEDVTVVIKKLLDVTLSVSNSLAMTYPTLTTAIGIPTDFALALGDTQTILTFIDGLSDIDPGFDYEVLHTKEFRIYSPHKYNPAVWDDSSFASYIFQASDDSLDLIVEGPHFVNHGPLATHLLAMGAGLGGQRVGVALGYTASQDVYRRLDMGVDYGDESKRDQLKLRAMRDFSFALNPSHEIEMSVYANKITDFWTLFEPGTAIWLDDDLRSHHIQSAQEIVMMDCNVTNEGECIVNLGLQQIYEGSAGVEQG